MGWGFIQFHRALVIENCGSNAAAISPCRMAVGHSRKPWTGLVTPTHVNKMVTPRLKTRRPSTVPRRDPEAVEGIQAIPSATIAAPAQRASAIPAPSGLAANSSMHGKSGAVRKMTPATSTNHAAPRTTDLCSTFFSLHTGKRSTPHSSSFMPTAHEVAHSFHGCCQRACVLSCWQPPQAGGRD